VTWRLVAEGAGGSRPPLSYEFRNTTAPRSSPGSQARLYQRLSEWWVAATVSAKRFLKQLGVGKSPEVAWGHSPPAVDPSQRSTHPTLVASSLPLRGRRARSVAAMDGRRVWPEWFDNVLYDCLPANRSDLQH
jgi:hypothetical protein